MCQKIIFDKPALAIEQQITLLKNRNLIIDDIEEASHSLSTIGYYRLMIYFKPFLISTQNSNIGFKPNTCFSDIVSLYIFDRELRLLVTDALERIEVSFRTAISNIMSLKHEPHWYLNPTLFAKKDQHEIFLDEIQTYLKRSHEDFIKTYYSKYYHPEHPPSRMVMECISFGTVSKIYSNIKDRAVRKEIGDTLGQFSEIIKSWMRALTYTRNLCAHHSRLWNRFFINKPQITAFKIYSSTNESPFYLQAYIMHVILHHISSKNRWQKKLFELFSAYPNIAFSEMGFRSHWKNDPFWEL